MEIEKRQWRLIEVVAGLAGAGVFAWVLTIHGAVSALEARQVTQYETLSNQIEREREVGQERHAEVIDRMDRMERLLRR